MSEPKLIATAVEKEIVLDRGAAFSLRVPEERLSSSVFLVIDIYAMDNPVHPEGHVGWWRYEIGELAKHPAGRLERDGEGRLGPVIDGLAPADEWRNPDPVTASRFELLVVLRSVITNAILSIDRVPVLESGAGLQAFRSIFDRNYALPRYAPPHTIMPPQRRVHLVSRNIFQRDAVGNLCLGLYRMLRQHQVAVELFADNFELALNDIIHRQDMLAERVGRDDIVLYFVSTFDGRLEELTGLQCGCKIAYFHGITPPKLLQVFDPELSMLCAKAIGQLPLLASFDRLAANSEASAEVLRGALGFGPDDAASPGIEVIPPKLVAAEETHPSSPGRKPSGPQPPMMLHVGRVIAHKRVEDLLRLLSAYRRLDPAARCTIVGSSDSPAYQDYLRWVQREELGLPDDAVVWRGSVTDDELGGIYDASSAYVSMSEHEGFCLPLIEAMARNVLVFAHDLPAVRETMGPAGVLFGEKSFDHLASQLHLLLSSPETLQTILAEQFDRARQQLARMDGRGFLRLIASR